MVGPLTLAARGYTRFLHSDTYFPSSGFISPSGAPFPCVPGSDVQYEDDMDTRWVDKTFGSVREAVA